MRSSLALEMNLHLHRIVFAASIFIIAGCEGDQDPGDDVPAAIVCAVPEQKPRVTFTLSREGLIAIEGTQISLAQLRAFSAALVRLNPDVQLKLNSDSEVDTSKVKEFVETVYGTGIKGVIFGSNVSEDSDGR